MANQSWMVLCHARVAGHMTRWLLLPPKRLAASSDIVVGNLEAETRASSMTLYHARVAANFVARHCFCESACRTACTSCKPHDSLVTAQTSRFPASPDLVVGSLEAETRAS